MNANNILVFFKSSTRAKNDAVNKLREVILENILYSPNLQDEQYGEQWKKVQESWKHALHGLTHFPYDHIQVIRKGGRKNHDFHINYYQDSHCVDHKVIEFKFSKSMNLVPQILSLYTSFNLFPTNYAIYYYDNYLDKYLSYVGIEKPPLDEYLNEVYKNKYTHPFFATLRERESEHKTIKSSIVNESIEQYLKINAHQILLPVLYEKIQSSQQKTYLLWNEKEFIVHDFKFEPLLYDRVNKNTLFIISGAYTLKLLLRWKNHKGIMGPAWQIKL
jgi:hypothetical protein